jgi:F-type H+-transporting ATPase subunit alpha
MSLGSVDISQIIKEQINKYEKKINPIDTGTIIQIGDGVAIIDGLETCMSGELIEFPGDIYGMALNLESETVSCVLLGTDRGIKEGDSVRKTGRIVEVPVGEELIGRVVNSLGQPIDGKGNISTAKYRPIENMAPGIIDRESVNEPLQTGIKAIDSMFPIGRGQRELIIGDRQTGKTSLAIDTIINQNGQDVICIYVAIGQKRSTVAQIAEILKENNAMDYTIIVASTASELAPLQYIAPYAGVTMAEEFMKDGKDVLIVYDDLSKHAVAYRTISLLLRRAPGREAFPGDVFYLHSRLLERAAKLDSKNGKGSITALPIIETLDGDISAYIPTNVISITDGQIFLETDLFFAGQRPAINTGLSVSRVGSSAQIKAIKKVSEKLKLELAQYRELAAFAQFGSELDKDTRERLDQGERIMETLKQPQYQTMSVENQVIIFYAAINKYLLDIPVNMVTKFEEELIKFVEENFPHILSSIRDTKDLSDETEKNIVLAINEFKKLFATLKARW